MPLTVHPSTCSVCGNIFLGEFPCDFQGDPPNVQEPYEWRKSLADLEASVQDGCRLCKVFHQWFHSELYGGDGPGPHQPGSQVDNLSLEMRHIDFDHSQLISITTSDGRGWLSFRVLTTLDDPTAHRILGRVPDQDVASDEAYERARRWITICDDSHEDCARMLESTLPTRVIDVRPPDEPGGAIIWISNGTKAPYVALSYCWGPSNYQTTRDNLGSHIRRLPCQALPQTINDAIHSTRQLGLRYLWVDSLCIIQDYEEDVAREIARMEDIYKNAYITISAASAKDCHSGFLGRRHSFAILPGEEPICLPYRCADGVLGTVGLFRHSTAGLVRDPIHERAWTLQEHLLSPRLLVYGTVQQFWSCASKFEQDGDLIALGNQATHEQWDLMKRVLSPSCTVQAQRDACSARESSYLWQRIPNEYPCPRINEPFKNLLAFAGQLWSPRSEEHLSYLSREQNYTPDSSELPIIRRLRELIYTWKDTMDVFWDQRLSQPFASLFVSSAMWTLQCIDLHQNQLPAYPAPRELVQLQNDMPENIFAPAAPFGKRLADCARTSVLQGIIRGEEYVDPLALAWKDIVEEYSSRKLTDPLDKLPALSAAASAFARTSRDEYVLGHWTTHLLPQLLWTSKDPTATRSSVWRCPSWSWLSMDGPVGIWPQYLERPAETPVAEVLSYSVAPVWDYAPYGRIASCSLVVKGWLKPVVLDARAKRAMPEMEGREHDQSVDIRLDCEDEYLEQHPSPAEGGPPDRKWCLTLVRWVPHFQWMLGKRDVAHAMGGLILDMTPEGARRIGAFSCNRIRHGRFSSYKEDPAVFIWTSYWLVSGETTTVTLI